jgi:hypothetical protein
LIEVDDRFPATSEDVNVSWLVGVHKDLNVVSVETKNGRQQATRIAKRLG